MMKLREIGTLIAVGLVALGALQASQALTVSVGFMAQELCTASFIARQDPATSVQKLTAAVPGADWLSWGFSYELDPSQGVVAADLIGIPARAQYRPGRGCHLLQDAAPQPQSLTMPKTDAPPVVPPASPALAQAIRDAFTESPEQPVRQTAAVVVMRGSQIVAEHYAPGIDAGTALHGFSATKTVTAALIGVLVRQEKLRLEQDGLFAEWRAPDDDRRRITIDHLLRHSSGLDMGSSLGSSLASAFDRVNRMKYAERDMTAYAVASPLAHAPGQGWNYHDGHYVLLSRLIRDQAGGTAEGVMAFARHTLFDPLGMGAVVLDFDATDTPDGSSQLHASARDWAKFGRLLLGDGVVDGQTILPPGFLAAASTPTPASPAGLGAGLWVNSGDSIGARLRRQEGFPEEARIARGAFGQYVIALPSRDLVIVRLGLAPGNGDEAGVAKLVQAIVAAI